MQKKIIKTLAKSLAKENLFSSNVVTFILKLGRDDLKYFLSNYKLGLKKNTVSVTSASEITSENLKEINQIYKNKRVIKKTDPRLGAGIKIEESDNIIDFTFKKYINDTIQMLK